MPAARWRLTEKRVRQNSLCNSLGASLIGLGLVLVISALTVFASASSHPESASEPFHMNLEAASLLGLGGMMAIYFGAILLIITARRPLHSDEMTLDAESSIRIEHAGNVFFIITLLASCLVSVVALISTGMMGILVGPSTLVFLLILRRAYIMDKRRDVSQRKSVD